MIVTLVHIWVKEPFTDAFISATIENQKHTLNEPGNLRFDFLRDEENHSKFILYEVFASEEAIAHHKSTSHYINWRDTVADWMDQPRKGNRHTVVSPLDVTQW
jgi:autoinducer 2-degrading protein